MAREEASKRLTKNEHLLRWSFFMVGLIIMSFGIALMIRADLGSAPWDVFHIGMKLQFGLTVGSWSIIAGFFIIFLTMILSKERPKIGAFINMILVGVFIDIFLIFLNTPDSLLIRFAFLIFGIIIMGYGIGLYIAPKFGAGPRDSLMLALTKITGWKVQWVRGAMEVVVLSIGWSLGGPVFIGTIIFSFGIGSVVGVTLPQCQKFVDFMIERGNLNEDIHERALRADNYDGAGKKAW